MAQLNAPVPNNVPDSSMESQLKPSTECASDECDHANSGVMDDLITIPRGLRNGTFYGTKIRLPHAAVMTFLFRSGTFKEKLDGVARLTYTHTKNLGLFAMGYNAAIVAGRLVYRALGWPIKSGVGLPVAPWHSFVAGGAVGYYVWGGYTGVNFQIVLYLLSRILVGWCKTLAAQGVKPFCLTTFEKTYPYFAALVWAQVMYLFEYHRPKLHRSLSKSMDFLYHDTNVYKSLADLLPSPATVAVLVYYFMYVHVQHKAGGPRRSGRK